MEGCEGSSCMLPSTVTHTYSADRHVAPQKMVRKQYAKLTGRSMDEHPDGEGGEHGAGGSGDEAKTKKPNLQRQMKSKLQKLVNKTDDECVKPLQHSRIQVLNGKTLVVVSFLASSWSSLIRRSGPSITRPLRSPFALKISS